MGITSQKSLLLRGEEVNRSTTGSARTALAGEAGEDDAPGSGAKQALDPNRPRSSAGNPGGGRARARSGAAHVPQWTPKMQPHSGGCCWCPPPGVPSRLGTCADPRLPPRNALQDYPLNRCRFTRALWWGAGILPWTDTAHRLPGFSARWR